MTEDVFPLQHRILSIAMEVCPKGNKVVQLLAVIFVMKKYISFILPLTHQRWPILGRILYIKNIRSVGSTFLHAFSASMLRGSQGKWSPSLHRRFVRIDGWLFLARCTMWKSNFCAEKHGLFLTSSIRKGSGAEPEKSIHIQWNHGNLSRPQMSFGLMVSTFPTEQHFLSKFRLSRDGHKDLIYQKISY